MTDVDQILRDHAAAAATTEPAADGWERLVTRLEANGGEADGGGADGGPGTLDRPARGRWALVVAAAVIALVAGVAAVAIVRADDGSEDLIRPADTVAPDPSTPGGPGRPDVDPDTRPDRIVAVVDHDGDGLADLVRIERLAIMEDVPGLGGVPARGLRPPAVTVLLPGTAVAPDPITSVDLGPDGTAYVGVGDEVRAIDVDDGLDRGPVAEGRFPAVSGDGRSVATVVGVDIHLVDIPSGEVTIVSHLKVDGQEVTGLSLSPDGERIARQRVTRAGDGTITDTAVDVTATDDPDGWVEVERSSGAGLPAFMDGGHLALGLGTWDASEGRDEVRASEVGMADLATGEVRWSVGGGGFSFVYFDATPDGRWVIVGHDGVVRAFSAVDGWLWDSGTVATLDGLVDAAW